MKMIRLMIKIVSSDCVLIRIQIFQENWDEPIPMDRDDEIMGWLGGVPMT